MPHVVLLVLILVESIYLIAGGFIFWSLESHTELLFKTKKLNFNLTALLTDFIGIHTSVPIENLTTFISHILEKEREGLLKEKEISNWDIHGSLFFAMTVVTTIGYGTVSPATTGGQLFCCLFAIVGIPLTMIILVGIGDLLKKLVAKINPWDCQGDPCWIYSISVGIWIFLGLAWLAGVIGTIQEGLQALISKIIARCKRKISKKTAADNNDKKESERSETTEENEVTDSVQLESISVETLDGDSKCKSVSLPREKACRNIAPSM